MPTKAPAVGRPPESVIVVRLSALGDAVHIMPILASLGQAWPDTRLAWVVQPAVHRLMAPHPDVDEFFEFDREGGAGAYVRLRRQLRGRKFDLALVPHTAFKAGLVSALVDAPRKLGYDRARAPELHWLFTNERIESHEPQHTQDEFLEFLSHLGVPPLMKWDFGFSAAELAERDRFFRGIDRPVLAVALRTSSPGKNWIAERYARVLEAAERDLGLQTMFVGNVSEADDAIAREVSGLTGARPLDARADDPRRLAWLLDGSAIALSPDTAPLHMAVALGTPTIGLYGATNPARVGPYGRYSSLTVDKFSSGIGMEAIEVQDVVRKLEEAVRSHLGGRGA